MLVDQRSQQRARASYRRRRRLAGDGGDESRFAESAFVSMTDTPHGPVPALSGLQGHRP
jgi:hypothetical protein